MAPSKTKNIPKKVQVKNSLNDQRRLLHNLVEELAGIETGRIVEILFGKKDVNEFSIAKKMELTINQVRNILYKLSNHGLVSFIRKKDKRKGWYIYYWTLNTEKCLVMLEQSLVGKIEELNNILGSRETKRFYICKPCGIEISEEKSLEHGFTCEECAEVYELSDNSVPIKDTKARITKKERDLVLIQKELDVAREKEKKRVERISKKDEKETAIKKEILKKARALARAKLKGKVEKKAPAKKKKKVKKKAPAKKKSLIKKLKKAVKKVKKKKSNPKKRR
jgi:transcription factor E